MATADKSLSPSARLRVARALCSRLPPVGGQWMRRRLYPQSLALSEDYRFTVRSLTGSPFTGVTSDHTAYPFAVHGYFNWRNVAIARAVCRKGDVIFDVGANIGTETVSFSDIVGAGGAVYAFEPLPRNLEQLRANAARTGYRNISVLPVALGELEGEIQFAVPPSENSGLGHVVGSARGAAEHGTRDSIIEVSCTTLDRLRSELASPKLITIDVEGHEGPILRGARELIAGSRPVVVLEVLRHLLERAGSSPEAIADQLWDFDYELYQLTRFGVKAIVKGGRQVPGDSDWLAVPSSDTAIVQRVRHTIHRSGLLPVLGGLNPLRRG